MPISSHGAGDGGQRRRHHRFRRHHPLDKFGLRHHDPAFYRDLWATILSGQTWRGELTNCRKDGSVFYGEQTITPVRSDTGTITHLVAIINDVTARKRAEEELVATQGMLLAGVAHELNNPLAVVIRYATILSALGVNGLVGERIQKIGGAAERCARIVRNFLALARQHPPERESVILSQIVVEAVELLAYALRVDNVEVRLDQAGDLALLWGDSHQLHQVVVNLITNAHHAMRDAPAPRRLKLATGLAPGQGRMVLEVRDSEPRISHQVQARMFEPFFTTKPAGQGAGLSLSICQGTFEGHGG